MCHHCTNHVCVFPTRGLWGQLGINGNPQCGVREKEVHSVLTAHRRCSSAVGGPGPGPSPEGQLCSAPCGLHCSCCCRLRPVPICSAQGRHLTLCSARCPGAPLLRSRETSDPLLRPVPLSSAQGRHLTLCSPGCPSPLLRGDVFRVSAQPGKGPSSSCWEGNMPSQGQGGAGLCDRGSPAPGP